MPFSKCGAFAGVGWWGCIYSLRPVFLGGGAQKAGAFNPFKLYATSYLAILRVIHSKRRPTLLPQSPKWKGASLFY